MIDYHIVILLHIQFEYTMLHSLCTGYKSNVYFIFRIVSTFVICCSLFAPQDALCLHYH